MRHRRLSFSSPPFILCLVGGVCITVRRLGCGLLNCYIFIHIRQLLVRLFSGGRFHGLLLVVFRFSFVRRHLFFFWEPGICVFYTGFFIISISAPIDVLQCSCFFDEFLLLLVLLIKFN